MWTISHPLGLSPDPNKDVWRINNNNLKTNKNPSWTPLNAAKNWGGHPALFSFWCLTFLSECFQSAYSWNLCNHEGPFASGSNHCLDIPCVKFSLSLFSFYILKQVLKSKEHKTNAVFILYKKPMTSNLQWDLMLLRDALTFPWSVPSPAVLDKQCHPKTIFPSPPSLSWQPHTFSSLPWPQNCPLPSLILRQRPCFPFYRASRRDQKTTSTCAYLLIWSSEPVASFFVSSALAGELYFS